MDTYTRAMLRFVQEWHPYGGCDDQIMPNSGLQRPHSTSAYLRYWNIDVTFNSTTASAWLSAPSVLQSFTSVDRPIARGSQIPVPKPR